ncbi:leucine--tRNA ligase [Trichonephila clavata]|uniref:Leucine--tRNA ligase n=1 Tax=Trichonephila clavata TaxID=2740835 RepID=A0A8X6J7J4_TRICU|nr:leucine--tRNA ligase [Trichonephila clavata]
MVMQLRPVNIHYDNENVTGICILIRVIEPFIPHLAESLWQEIGGQPWPKADESLLVDDTVTIAVQINGKLRTTIKVAINLPQEELKK